MTTLNSFNYLPPPANIPLRRTIVGFAAFFVMFIGTSIISAPVLLFADPQAILDGAALPPALVTAALIITIIGQLATIIGAVAFTHSQSNWRTALLLNPVRDWRVYAFCFGLGLCLFLLLQIIGLGLLGGGVELADSDTSTLLASVTGPMRWIVLGLLAPIVVPFVEELFFRGLLLNSIRTGSLGFRHSAQFVTAIAVIFTSLVFALGHLQFPLDFTALFILGYTLSIALINCWLAINTNSILPSFALHLGYNLFTTIAILIAPQLI